MGDVIMRDSVRKVSDLALITSTLRSFSCGAVKLSFSVWVDNIYAAGDELEHAMRMLESLDKVLKEHWRLRLKPSSRLWISAAGHRELAADLDGWTWQEPFVVLGHRVARSGSCAPDLAAAEHGAWIRWLSGGGSCRHRDLPLDVRVADAHRV